jgi:hypothetical protein
MAARAECAWRMSHLHIRDVREFGKSTNEQRTRDVSKYGESTNERTC